MANNPFYQKRLEKLSALQFDDAAVVDIMTALYDIEPKRIKLMLGKRC